MLDLVLFPLRAIAFLSLVTLPGAWLSFGPLGRNLPPWTALFISVTLSPLVVVPQFYVLRLLGVSFATTAILLVFLNLPALGYVLRRFSHADLPDFRGLFPAGALLAAPLALLFVHFQDLQVRALYAHAWMHADIVYRIVAGDLPPEEASLAGFTLAYPWGHIYQALLSYLADVAPASSYAWTNALWLLAIFGITAAVVARLGGNRRSQALACVFLAFAVNPIGSSLQQFLPQDFLATYGRYLGDSGYAPWLRKYYGFDQLPLALGSFAAILLLAIQPRAPEAQSRTAVLIGLQLCALGMVYPVLFPAGCIVLIARVAALWLAAPPDGGGAKRGETLSIAGVMLLAAFIVYGTFGAMNGGRWIDLVPAVDGPWHIRLKAVKSVVALSIPLLGFAFAVPSLWRPRREIVVLVAFVTVACMAVYSLLDVPYARNEYKYILAAAICLAPFPALALEPVIARLGRGGVLLAAVVVVMLAIPPSWRLYDNWPRVPGYRPGLVIEGLNIALAPGERFSGALAAIRDEAPGDGIVAAAEAAVHLPTLTRRVHYAPYEAKAPLAGYAAGPDYFLTKGRGGARQVLDERRRVLRQLYHADSETGRAVALRALSALGRPIVILVDLAAHAALQAWLVAQDRGEMIYRDQEAAVWVLAADLDLRGAL